MPSISAIYWDIGGVLLTNGWDTSERKTVYAQFGIDGGPIEGRHEKLNDAWEKGGITVWEYLREVVFFEERAFTPRDFFAAMKAQSRVLHPRAIDVLKQLAATRSYKICALNNESAELHEYRMERFGLGSCFDAQFCSAFIGMRKPHEAIYLAGMRVMAMHAENAVFIDDREENARVAASLGIHAVQFQSPEQLAAELNKLGVAVNL